jgi:hypothetical protein
MRMMKMVQNYSQYIKRIGTLNRNSEVLSASIISSLNQVFYADDLSSPCINARDLSVRYVTAEQFHKMVNGDPSVSAWFEPTTLYVVSSDEINAYNTNIKNVADPLEPKDAANKRYVDEKIDETQDTLSGDYLELTAFSKLSNAIGLSSASSIDPIATKSYVLEEVSSKSSINLSSIGINHIEGGQLDRLNIVRFDNLSTYQLCTDANPNFVSLSDIVLIDENQLNAEMYTIISVAAPQNDTDAANKKYVDGKLSGITSNNVLQTFYNTVSISGINSVGLEHIVSAVCELIKALR